MNGVMAKILIYGGGKAAKTIIEMLRDDKNVEIAALTARNLDKEGAVYAKESGIKCFKTIKEVNDANINYNIIFNLTGEPELELAELALLHDHGIEIINSVSSKLIYDLLYDRHKIISIKKALLSS